MEMLSQWQQQKGTRKKWEKNLVSRRDFENPHCQGNMTVGNIWKIHMKTRGREKEFPAYVALDFITFSKTTVAQSFGYIMQGF